MLSSLLEICKSLFKLYLSQNNFLKIYVFLCLILNFYNLSVNMLKILWEILFYAGKLISVVLWLKRKEKKQTTGNPYSKFIISVFTNLWSINKCY